jgi:hypothetical protein
VLVGSKDRWCSQLRKMENIDQNRSAAALAPTCTDAGTPFKPSKHEDLRTPSSRCGKISDFVPSSHFRR